MREAESEEEMGRHVWSLSVDTGADRSFRILHYKRSDLC